MENRIKEQMCLFADRLSTDEMKGNQLRLYFSSLAYTLMEALRRLALKGTVWAEAQVGDAPLRSQDRRHRSGQRAPRAAPTQLCLPLEGQLHPSLPRPALLNATPYTDNPDSIFTELSARQNNAPLQP